MAMAASDSCVHLVQTREQKMLGGIFRPAMTQSKKLAMKDMRVGCQCAEHL